MARSEHRFTFDAPAPTRLDTWLAAAAAISRGRVRRLLDQQRVLCNDRPLQAKDKNRSLQPGDVVTILGPLQDTDEVPQPCNQPNLTLLNQGEGWVMFNKPAGMPVHPLQPDETHTLLNHAITIKPEIIGVGEAGLRSGIVHRLDVATSGIVVIATQQNTWQAWRQAFEQHETIKHYRAIVHGRPPQEITYTRRLLITQHHPAKVSVIPPNDPRAEAATVCNMSIRVIETDPSNESRFSLIEVDLGTGFLHQIRAIMAAERHPVVGDPIYTTDNFNTNTSATRLMLHASHLQWQDHIGHAPWPAECEKAWQKLRST